MKKKKINIMFTVLIIFMTIFILGTVLSASFHELVLTIIFAILLIISLITILIAFCYTIKYCYYTCPKCHQNFKPTNAEIIFALHTFTKRYLKCPHCNKKVWCYEDFVDEKKMIRVKSNLFLFISSCIKCSMNDNSIFI